MSRDTCILIPTFPAQIEAARLSVELLDKYWPTHPEIFLCGLEADDPRVLPMTGDPRDWMAIVHGAALGLKARGFRRVFLILDDQGPIAPCHVHHLDHTVPDWMTELDAVYISLRGWDHRRNSSGDSLGPGYLHLQRQHAHFAWRYALHPALWKLDVLIEGLALLMEGANVEARSAWAFEIRAGASESPFPPEWHGRTYRLHGRRMTLEPIGAVERAIRHGIDGSVRWLDARLKAPPFRRMNWPRGAQRLLVNLLKTDDVCYSGPYPMFYSGFLMHGRVNPYLEKYLQRAGRTDLQARIRACARISDSPP